MSRLRTRLAKMIEEAMLEQFKMPVVVDDFIIAQGFYRTDSRSDSYRWEAYGKVGQNARITLSSYTTMTKIVASKGVTIVKDRGHAYSFEVYDATGN